MVGRPSQLEQARTDYAFRQYELVSVLLFRSFHYLSFTGQSFSAPMCIGSMKYKHKFFAEQNRAAWIDYL